MARTWAHRCGRNLARTIGLQLFPPQLPIHERLNPDLSLKFSQRGLRFYLTCNADCSSRIALEFEHHSRAFSTIPGTKEVAEKQGKRTLTLKEARRKSRPLGRTSSAVIRQLKDRGFDDIIERGKKLKIVLNIKELLGAVPSRSMTVLDLGKYKDDIGFKGEGRLIAFLKHYPAVFTVHETSQIGKLPWFQFTAEADAAFDEELAIRKRMDDEVVTKLRKLLMMSSDKSLSLSKIAHLGRDLGLPDDFRQSLVYHYPKYFRVVARQDPLDVDGPKLELVRWSSRLAVTEAERKAQEQEQQRAAHDSPSTSELLHTPKHHRLFKFEGAVCPSPYQDASHLHRRSTHFEKRAVLLIQELLSLTLEKQVLVDHLTHFRKEFNFSRKLRGMLIRHPEYFYVSRKGSRDTVFLRGAFAKILVSGTSKQYCLVDKHPLILVKEKLAALMEVKQLDSNNVKDFERPFQERVTPVFGRRSSTPKIPW